VKSDEFHMAARDTEAIGASQSLCCHYYPEMVAFRFENQSVMTTIRSQKCIVRISLSQTTDRFTSHRTNFALPHCRNLGSASQARASAARVSCPLRMPGGSSLPVPRHRLVSPGKHVNVSRHQVPKHAGSPHEVRLHEPAFASFTCQPQTKLDDDALNLSTTFIRSVVS
jgi:hypothetical protein